LLGTGHIVKMREISKLAVNTNPRPGHGSLPSFRFQL
jgi:hypothetical protein